jgi:hypothetical protein
VVHCSNKDRHCRPDALTACDNAGPHVTVVAVQQSSKVVFRSLHTACLYVLVKDSARHTHKCSSGACHNMVQSVVVHMARIPVITHLKHPNNPLENTFIAKTCDDMEQHGQHCKTNG